MSLTSRILLSFLLIAAAAYFALLGPVLDRVERQYLEAAEEPMVDMAQVIAAILSNPPEGIPDVPSLLQSGMADAKKRQFSAQIYNLLKTDILLDFYVTDASGSLIYDSSGQGELGADYTIHRDVAYTLAGKYGARSSRSNEADANSSIMYVAAPILNGEEIIGVSTVYKPQRSMLLFIKETKRRLVYLGVLTGLLILLMGYLLSRWISLPLRRLTEYADAVSKGERVSLPKMPGYHLRVLGETTEAMRSALEDRKYVESYVQSLTHEMKSPVAGIRGAAELLHEDLPAEKRIQFLNNIGSESERLQKLIDRLLALSSLENRTELGAPTEIELNDLVCRVMSQLEPSSAERRIVMKLDSAEDFKVMGEEFLVEISVSNLLQNAIDFSPQGATIHLRIKAAEKWVILMIEDEGSGIPDFALDRIFDRFYSLPRPNSERKSSGLGLCFVREAVDLQGGHLEILNRTDRPGVLATLKLMRVR